MDVVGREMDHGTTYIRRKLEMRKKLLVSNPQGNGQTLQMERCSYREARRNGLLGEK
jgi:hypothetical protein